MKRLSFFPTPHPDEILYSVLCRYHIRCGVPSAPQTNLALWGNRYGKKLFLPDAIENMAGQIPCEANLTAEYFAERTTILPLLKPFLRQSKYDDLFRAMKFGDPDIYNIVSFSKVFTLQHRYLRYCPECVEIDAKMCGEPYWHRVHQLPGVYICPIHGVITVESDIKYDDLRNDFYPLLFALSEPAQMYDPDITVKLLDISHDMAWLLQHRYDLQYLEHTDELYDNRLRVKEYRAHNGKTSVKKLAQDIVDYYGRGFLDMLDAYNSGACIWIKRIIERKQHFQHPLYHMLLMRFLSGSVSKFFTDAKEKPPEYLPFGISPYPCRNYVCEYHLQDVIQQIVITRANGEAQATFSCPHCGFAYRRKGKVPKERQYYGQINIVDYGWKWEKEVTMLLYFDESPYKIARDFHCDVRTILTFGVERGILPAERRIERNPYIPVDLPQERADFDTQRELYRERWLAAINANPAVTRKELRVLDSKADQWLHLHDAGWLEQNSPPSKKTIPSWADRDDEYLEKITEAIKQILAYPGRPKQVSIAFIGKQAGIIKPHTRLMSDKLPKTKAFIEKNIETLEQWQRRKIIWAVKQMREQGEIRTVYKVRHAACIEDKERKMDEFILECIHNSE